MASFTDIIPKFNPYIQQLPVEAMVQVGMAKQQAYEQNVTKIQSQIDAIGGLDVARDVDRKYLQSKINELGSRLNRLASSDFSNFQLVNAVGGMTNQVVKDEAIQTAVNSTAWARKQRDKIEKGKADGTWSIENEDLYNEQYSKWYNGTQVGEAFSSEYIPYRDVYKKLREIAKDVGVEESLVQNLFNPDGSVNRVMVETYSKGKDPNKIYEAFVNGIDQSDYRQLAITGKYKYKGYSNDQLVEMLQNSNSEYTDLANTRKLDLQQRLKQIDTTIPTLKKEEDKVNYQNERNKIIEAISKIDEQVAESNRTFNDSKNKLASGDEDYANSIRSRIHMNNFLGTLSRDFADKTSYVKYAENPLWKAMMEEKKFALDAWYKQSQIAVDQAKLQFEKDKAKKEEEEKLAYSTAGAISGGSSDITVEGIQETYGNFVKDRDKQFFELAKSCFDGDVDALNKYVTAAQGVKIKDPKTGILRNKTREEVLESLGVQEYTRLSSLINNKQLTGSTKGQSYGDNPTAGINPQILERVYNLGELNTFVTGMKVTMEQLEKETYSELGLSGPDDLIAKTETKPEEKAWYEVFWDILKVTSPSTSGLASGFTGSPTHLPVRQYIKEQPELVRKFDEKLLEKYKESFEGFYPENLGFIMNEKNRDVVVGKLNATLYKNPGYSEGARAALFENNSQLMFQSKPSKTGLGGGVEYSAIITDKDGTQYDPILITADQYKFLAGREAPTPDMELVLTRARINASPDSSTNLQGLGNWQTALVPGASFTNIKSYNIGGMDLTQSTNDPNAFYPVLYIAPSGSNDYKQYPIQRAGTLSEGMALPYLITDSELKAKGISF